jgi:hypothetical protein
VGTISITFHAASMDDLSTDIANWLSSSGRRLGITGRTGVVGLEPKDQPAAIAKVVSGVHGEQSLRLLRQLADAGIQGQPVALTTSLVTAFGVASGTAFAGMIGPVNRRAKTVLGRPLIGSRSPDPNARSWRIESKDAWAVLEAFRAASDSSLSEGPQAPAAPGSTASGSSSGNTSS